jgi:hypothetical protein
MSAWIADGGCANVMTTIHPVGNRGYSPDTPQVYLRERPLSRKGLSESCRDSVHGLRGFDGFARIFLLKKSVFIPFVREIRVQKGLITAILNEPRKAAYITTSIWSRIAQFKNDAMVCATYTTGETNGKKL